MKTINLYKLSLAGIFAILVSACSSTDTTPEPEPESQAPVEQEQTTPRTTPVDPDAGLSAAEIRERDQALATTVFYFEFDRSELSPEAREALIYHANRLRENPNLRYRLEGHADERGTREYNLALGERRAQAIERYLEVQGVRSSQLETISYGEEMPADPGTSEAAYARNRRVEIH